MALFTLLFVHYAALPVSTSPNHVSTSPKQMPQKCKITTSMTNTVNKCERNVNCDTKY